MLLLHIVCGSSVANNLQLIKLAMDNFLFLSSALVLMFVALSPLKTLLCKYLIKFFLRLFIATPTEGVRMPPRYSLPTQIDRSIHIKWVGRHQTLYHSTSRAKVSTSLKSQVTIHTWTDASRSIENFFLFYDYVWWLLWLNGNRDNQIWWTQKLLRRDIQCRLLGAYVCKQSTFIELALIKFVWILFNISYAAGRSGQTHFWCNF